MSKLNEIQINETIIPYLNEIAERLWSGHAAVMVGAGFSKNAKPNGTSCPGFPDWSQLGDLFYERIHGRKPDNQKYLNVLKLADEVQAALGRSVLDQLLRSAIPDKDYEPSPLHVKLLDLPWTDVFTTNYDTLLERACLSVTSQKYDVVVNREDLVYSEKPRIIKLHGSFPSERPFIITEEDYRQYPNDFAPFVNTVQQALLENTLCLVGFSGDDPNFLQWIGWIRDNLGRDNSPKIYLIGIVRISEAQVKLLEQRNIVLVNLADCSGIEGDDYSALDLFCEFLLSRKEDNRLGWPMDLKRMHFDRDRSDKAMQIKEILGEWKSVRMTYPGWCVLPEDRRSSLWRFTQDWINFISPKDNLLPPLDIEFAYELNWRMEKCLCPIVNKLNDQFEKLLTDYWPFPGSDQENIIRITPGNPDYQMLDWNDIRQMWIHLSLSILRFYREEGLHAKWQHIDETLERISLYLSPDQKAFLSYERTLYALFTLDVPEVRKQLLAWPLNESLPFWEAKRASVLAEIGQIDDAERILEQSLQNTRSKLNLKPITTEYSLVSREAFLMLLLQYVRNASIFRAGNWQKNEEQRREFTERWNVLKRYKCDPWNELRLFESRLEQASLEHSPIIEKREFDIGSVTRSHKFGYWELEERSAYEFLRFCEDAGIPFRIPGATLGKKSAEGTLPRISKYSPYWALATLVRIGDDKVVDYLFNRESLYKLDIATVDSFIAGYLKTVERNRDDIQIGDGFFVDNFGIRLAQIIPEILSRLCSKCSYKIKSDLLDFLLHIYKSDQRTKYRGIRHLTKRLLESLSNHQRLMAIPKLLEFPVLEILDPRAKDEFHNPFIFLKIDNAFSIACERLVLDESRINNLFEQGRSENHEKRKWAIFTLIQLHHLGLLRDDGGRLGEVLWAQRDDYGFPAHTSYYKFAFFDLPHPDGVEMVPLFKKYLQETSFPIQKNKNSSGVAITGGDFPIYYEIVGSSRFIKWTEEEVLTIFVRLVEWWDTDKVFLRKNEDPHFISAIPDEFKARFSKLLYVFSEVIAPALNQGTNNTVKDTVIRLFSELNEFELPTLRSEAACVHLFPDNRMELIFKIEEALGSNEKEVVIDALQAILIIFKKERAVYSEADLSNVFNVLGQMLRWRRKIGLASTLIIIGELIKEYPSCFNNEFQELVLKGLKDIAGDSDLTVGSAELDFFEKLEIRKAAASLAYMLFVHYSKQGKPVPKFIKAWEDICRSEEEFAEIRNQWLSIDGE
jgi:hypothetical protein